MRIGSQADISPLRYCGPRRFFEGKGLPSLQSALPSSATHPSGPVPVRNAAPDLLKSKNNSNNKGC